MKNTTQEDRTNIEFFKPIFKIGQTIYVPQKNKVVTTKIAGYYASIGEEKAGKLIGIISDYHVSNFVHVRRGDESELTNILCLRDFCEDLNKAQEESRFLEVKLDEESWKIAVGVRDLHDENSPYSLEHCNLPPCCANISEARDILNYCKRNNGLTIHDRNELTKLLFEGHEFEYDPQSPIGRIFEQLQVK